MITPPPTPAYTGLTPALSCAVLATLGPATQHPPRTPETRYISPDPIPGQSAHPTARLTRALNLATALATAIARQPPQLVAILAYTGTDAKSVAWQIESSAILRLSIISHDWPLIEVPPRRLRRFTTGSPDAGPAELLHALEHTYALTFRSYHEAVAYGLAHLARCLATDGDGYTYDQRMTCDPLMAQLEDPPHTPPAAPRAHAGRCSTPNTPAPQHGHSSPTGTST